MHSLLLFSVEFPVRLETLLNETWTTIIYVALVLFLFYLSVQFFHQRDVSRYGVDPEVFFRAWVKGEAISHLLALRVGAVEAVDLRT